MLQEAYQKLQDDWTRRVETQRDWLSKSIDSRSLTLDNRLKVLSFHADSYKSTKTDHLLTSTKSANTRLSVADALDPLPLSKVFVLAAQQQNRSAGQTAVGAV